MRHSGGLCLRVQGTHAPSFRCDRERSIACFSKWIEAVGQIGGGTKRCPKAVGSHYSSRVRKQAWFWGKISLGLPSLRKGANDDNSSNRKPRVGKRKPKRKRDKLKYFLCDGPHMLKKCLKKSALKEKQVGKALVAEVYEEVCH
ncbi:hypothetical protein Gotur_008430 [Gossypium turneri]